MGKKKIFMAGVGGMLGDAFYKIYRKEYDLKCTDIDTNEEWIEYLDFRDYNKYKNQVIAYKPDYLFHIGAYTDLEYCEKNIKDTYNTNTISVENAVLIANELNIPVLYISTAGIFDGKKEVYNDWDQANPLDVYAKAKYYGERYVVENAKKYFVFRAGWMMGGGPKKDKKFINKIIKQIKEGKKCLHIVDDKDGTPTYTIDFAKNTKLVVESNLFGLYNLVCKGMTSRLEVAKEILNILNLSNDISIEEVNSDYFKDIYFAERPPCERLTNLKLDLRNMNIMREWNVALKEYIENDYAELIKR